MKQQKKQAIKRFYKKSSIPAILLFLIFLVICVYFVFALMFYFQQYIVDQKVSAIHDEAEYWKNIIAADSKEGDLLNSINSFGKYLGEENDICITDENNNMLKSFKNTAPDFDSLIDNDELYKHYRLYTDTDNKDQGEALTEYLSFGGIWGQLKALLMTEDVDDKDWLSQTIFSASYWVEIPLEIDGYRLYYKAPLVLVKRDIFFILAISVEVMIPLMIPVILLTINVISSVRMQRRMIKLLYMDSVTGGKNWLYFVQHSKKILTKRRITGNFYEVVSLHMNRYQEYCLCYGNEAGEDLLTDIDAFLQTQLGKQEVFARFSKADFGLLLQVNSVEQSEKRLEKLLTDLTGIRSDRTVAFQVGLYQIDPATLRKNKKQLKQQLDINQFYHYANAARLAIHEKDGQFIKLFDEQILQEQMWKHKVKDTMEAALRNHEFQMYLQPKYNPVSNKLVGAEALVRWISPTEGIIPPGKFIPIFEENGFITHLDDYMLEAVAKFQAERKKQGKKTIIISVNVSRANFIKDNLPSHICQLIDKYGAEHSSIELEITESAFFDDKRILQKILRELKGYGFRLSMDDFGSGYSSLNSLKELPVDVLKLDMEFFRGTDIEKRGEIVVKEAIQLAKNLDMEVVAEGIEKKEQVEFLAANKCDMIQGYYFAKPMPIEEFDERAERDA